MRDFYAPSSPAPLDQADGLRRLFAGQQAPARRLLALAANPHVAFAGVVLDRIAAALAVSGRHVLVVDAGAGAPLPDALVRVDLASGIERIAPRVGYLPARGLPLAYVDTRGSASGFVDALYDAAPWADVVLLHAEATELARVLLRRAVRPLLLGADHPESIKHAYASCKLLVRRCGLMTYDLLLAAAPQSPRAVGIAASLGQCAEDFLGALLQSSALIDPAGDAAAPPEADLQRLLAAQLALHEHPAWPGAAVSAAVHGAPAPTLNRPAFR